MDESTAGSSSIDESVGQENVENVEKKIESSCHDSSDDGGGGDEEAGGDDDEDDRDMDKFRQTLRSKRQSVVLELKTKIDTLRQQLTIEKEINEQLRRQKSHCNCSGQQQMVATTTTVSDNPDNEPELDDGISRSSSSVALKSELADVQLSLQLANAEILSLTSELRATQRQVSSLKEVIVFSKQMVEIRENQLSQLKLKLKEIEDSLAERELKLMSDQLRTEYDRQLTNIRNLRALYEERARVSAAERENLLRQLDTKRTELEAEVEKSSNLEARLIALEMDLDQTTTNLSNVQEQFSGCKSEKKTLHEEMTVINQLFSQLITGFSGDKDINIDKLTNMLEDNRELLNDITNREASQSGSAALPKLLFDLVSQAEEENSVEEATAEDGVDDDRLKDSAKDLPSAKDIVNNLPKVWKVLIELLNHQKAETVTFNEKGESEDCYNSVQTPTGPQLVLSVSKTYIKLKDLILEKKFLQKETNKLKNLNNHLESRLGQQEKRLGTVTVELNKTWNLVGRMQRQHRQLHTHEQVLRYQLQQKRRMLNELKDELEYCRRKWALAREKNNESQTQWNSLRKEFSNRKLMDANNSAESGYSDDPNSDDEHVGGDEKNAIDRRRSASPAGQQNEIVPPDGSRGTSAPPQWTAETVLESLVDSAATLTEESVATQVHDVDLSFAAASSVVAIESSSTATATTLSTELPGAAAAVAVIKRGKKNKKLKDAMPADSKKKSTEKQLPELCREKRLKEKQGQKAVDAAAGETLEQMFYRLSGQEPPAEEAPTTTTVEESDDDEESEESDDDESDEDKELPLADLNDAGPSTLTALPPPRPIKVLPPPVTRTPSSFELEDEERRANRTARFQRLEEQCQQLINQVTRTSHRGDELNSQLDQVQRRYTPNREVTAGAIAPDEGAASSSSGLTVQEEEYTSRRAARLRRLEEECKAYLDRVNTTNSRANALDHKLTSLHERYGSAGTSASAASSTTATCKSIDEIVDEIDSSADDGLDESLIDEQNVRTLPNGLTVATALLTNISESLDVAADEVYEQNEIIRQRTQSEGNNNDDDDIEGDSELQ